MMKTKEEALEWLERSIKGCDSEREVCRGMLGDPYSDPSARGQLIWSGAHRVQYIIAKNALLAGASVAELLSEFQGAMERVFIEHCDPSKGIDARMMAKVRAQAIMLTTWRG
jgi:hypothetical protein|tara:strand:+ start:691 stop:1026 length:336 start_codon:yes stop_codon:yes gene_type:complete